MGGMWGRCPDCHGRMYGANPEELVEVILSHKCPPDDTLDE